MNELIHGLTTGLIATGFFLRGHYILAILIVLLGFIHFVYLLKKGML